MQPKSVGFKPLVFLQHDLICKETCRHACLRLHFWPAIFGNDVYILYTVTYQSSWFNLLKYIFTDREYRIPHCVLCMDMYLPAPKIKGRNYSYMSLLPAQEQKAAQYAIRYHIPARDGANTKALKYHCVIHARWSLRYLGIMVSKVVG